MLCYVMFWFGLHCSFVFTFWCVVLNCYVLVRVVMFCLATLCSVLLRAVTLFSVMLDSDSSCYV